MSDITIVSAMSLCGLYVLLILLFFLGILRKPQRQIKQRPSVSVIIPARNESTNIDACLQSLADQTYPHDLIEIIVVNDRSTDNTENLVYDWTNRLSNLHCISVTQQIYDCPKKNALWQGIQKTQTDLIFTTDADCRPEPNWVESTVAHFAQNTGMVIGHAPLEQNQKILSGLLSLQALIVSTLAAGSAGIGFPLTCTGRNLAFRRQAFDEVEGYHTIGHIIGGDDVLLMNLISKTKHWKICFNPNSSVPSASHPDNLFHRQVRYQSKTIHYSIPILILASAVYIFHAILLTLPIFFFLNLPILNTLGLCLAIKIVADALLLLLGAYKFKSLKLLLWFPVLQILIIPYIVIICALGTFSPFKWK